MDMRGYGDSDKPSRTTAYTMEILERDIVDVVKALQKDKCILVAHDWGWVIVIMTICVIL
jgi:pimeloyl-ACP methyl ester carboxylesterase